MTQPKVSTFVKYYYGTFSLTIGHIDNFTKYLSLNLYLSPILPIFQFFACFNFCRVKNGYKAC